MDATHVVVLEGLFCLGKNPKLTEDPLLNERLWAPSARVFKLCNLHVMENLTKFWGKWYWCDKMVGVVDLGGSPTPFFIPEKKAKELRQLLSRIKR